MMDVGTQSGSNLPTADRLYLKWLDCTMALSHDHMEMMVRCFTNKVDGCRRRVGDEPTLSEQIVCFKEAAAEIGKETAVSRFIPVTAQKTGTRD